MQNCFNCGSNIRVDGKGCSNCGYSFDFEDKCPRLLYNTKVCAHNSKICIEKDYRMCKILRSND
jgi:hypothetical protein